MLKALKSKYSQAGAAVAVSLGSVVGNAVNVFAQEPACDAESITSGDIGTGALCAKPDGAAFNLFGSDGSIFNSVTNALLFLVGAISVIMLIVGGIRYVVSAGDQNAVTGAKNTILYAIVGIIVSFLAYAAVNFVTGQLGTANE